MRVAISHDYLFQFGGAEKCLEAWLESYPEAVIYTSFYVSSKFKDSPEISKAIAEKRVRTSFLQWVFKVPGMLKFQKHLFFLYPLAMSLMRIRNYDLVIISATYCGKNVRISGNSKNIFYCYTPTRFLHGLEVETDRSNIPSLLRFFLPFFVSILGFLDARAVGYLVRKKTVFISISYYIKNKVKQIYKQDSEVIYPPVEVKKLSKINRKVNLKDPFYIYFGRISFHKRVDLAIKACLELGRKLIIIGATSFQPEMDKLETIIQTYKLENQSKKVDIQFVGRVSDQERNQLLAEARAMLFTPKEDFGIAPVEALASGCPVIAFGEGGALEYIKEGLNGTFFEKQKVDSLKKAILKFEKMPDFDLQKVKQSSLKFSKTEFKKNFEKLVDNL